MDNTLPPSGAARAGTLGGTFLVLLSLNAGAIVETVVLATIGAAVSFGVSLALNSLLRRRHKH